MLRGCVSLHLVPSCRDRYGSSKKVLSMKSSELIRWSGLAAVIAGALFIVVNLIALLILSFGQGSFELLVRSAISSVAGTLLVLGLFGLYARQAEVTGIVGLIGFSFVLFGTILALAGNVWANLLAYLGWALFGVALAVDALVVGEHGGGDLAHALHAQQQPGAVGGVAADQPQLGGMELA